MGSFCRMHNSCSMYLGSLHTSPPAKSFQGGGPQGYDMSSRALCNQIPVQRHLGKSSTLCVVSPHVLSLWPGIANQSPTPAFVQSCFMTARVPEKEPQQALHSYKTCTASLGPASFQELKAFLPEMEKLGLQGPVSVFLHLQTAAMQPDGQACEGVGFQPQRESFLLSFGLCGASGPLRQRWTSLARPASRCTGRFASRSPPRPRPSISPPFLAGIPSSQGAACLCCGCFHADSTVSGSDVPRCILS